ncbi:hypothetical protein GOQ30_18065 [Flavobacterium sp. TP390]|uniref:Lipoprotein n=1 Tax=Flavobacterium profundi TaxID=1774945 RepID=A0A6I4IW74_9FLAO|nr:hypothetical protein [Flavobacterium profundi]MVO11080.1 hypothetical protein [Flavobacterium profundi]
MKIRKIFFGIIILGFFASCKSQYSTSELKNNFTENEIEDLNKIREFFISETCVNTQNDFKSCFKKIPHEYLQAYGNGFWENINFERQTELYKQISKSTFDKIWMFCKSGNPNEPDKHYKFLCAVSQGQYSNYLSELGKNNKRIAEYAKSINDYGAFTSLELTTWEILNNKKYINLNDPNVQLILAIHFLTLNDDLKRVEIWTE